MKEIYLITGATGFVGSCLAHRLVKNGKTVHVVSRKSKANWRLKDIEKQLIFHSINLCDNKLIPLLYKIKPTYVFHLASYGSLPKENEINKMIETNLLGTANLIKSLDFKTIKLFVNTGSSAEYKTINKAFKETDPLQPMNDYGISKVAQTLFCQKEALQKNLPIITFRLFSPYGYFEEPSRLIPYVILHAINNNDIHLANKKYVRDFIFVEDVINAYLQACDVIFKPGEIFNIGSGEQHTVYEVVKKILGETGSISNPQWGEIDKQFRQIEPMMWQADITKAKKMLLWKPKYSIETGIKETIDWFKNNQNLYA